MNGGHYSVTLVKIPARFEDDLSGFHTLQVYCLASNDSISYSGCVHVGVCVLV